MKTTEDTAPGHSSREVTPDTALTEMTGEMTEDRTEMTEGRTEMTEGRTEGARGLPGAVDPPGAGVEVGVGVGSSTTNVMGAMGTTKRVPGPLGVRPLPHFLTGAGEIMTSLTP